MEFKLRERISNSYDKATGTVGTAILKALVSSNRFHITALTRSDSTKTSTLPANIETPQVDYSNHSSLQTALQGQDAVVCALGPASATEQRALLDASVSAGVKRFLPSQYGSDTLNPKAAQLPVSASKKTSEQQVEELAAQDKITYTYVMSGPFLDFGLQTGFIGLDLKKRQIRYLDAGNAKFSTTTRATVGEAVVGVLAQPEETKNRAVYVQDTAVSLKHLLGLAKQALGGEGWTEVDAGTTEETEKASYDKLASGQKDMTVFLGFLLSSMFREGYGGQFPKTDNELLGIKELTDGQIMELIKDISKEQAA